MTNFDIYFRDLQADAKRNGVRVDRADEFVLWKAAATQDLINAVRDYSIAHYQSQSEGWYYVVECYSDGDLTDIIKGCRTAAGAIERVRAAIKPRGYADYRYEIKERLR